MALHGHASRCADQPVGGRNRAAGTAQRGAVFGLLDVDDEFFVIVRPAPAGTRLLLSDATAALDYDIADEVLEKLDVDIVRRTSTTPTRSRRVTSDCCRISACPRRCSA